jgi:signal transduction histidine kinase
MSRMTIILAALALTAALAAQPSPPGPPPSNGPQSRDQKMLTRPNGMAQTERELMIGNVHLAAVGLGGVFANMPDTKQRTIVTRDFVKPIRFFKDQSGYLYVYDMNGINIAHAAQPENQNKNLMSYQDSHGIKVIEQLAITAKKGGGTVEFWWKNPATGQDEKKLGYCEPIPGTDWFIGSGVYIKDTPSRAEPIRMDK